MEENSQNERPFFAPREDSVDQTRGLPYAFELTPPVVVDNRHQNQWGTPTDLAHSRSLTNLHPHLRGGRPASAFEPGTETMAMPEPDLYRSASQRSNMYPPYPARHQFSKSDFGPMMGRLRPEMSTTSFASETSYYDQDYFPTPSTVDLQLSRELSDLSLDSSEGIRRFQNGELPEVDQQWHRLVPFEAREALGKREVERQSVLFEVFTSEKEYVSDLQIVQEVFIEPLRNSSPPVIAKHAIEGFISDVFWNIDRIHAHHRRMLSNLFERQREQHPLIQSVADIVLDTLLGFRDDYESYIKHYPIAEALHRAELGRNPLYQAFMQKCSNDPGVRKRDLITFLSRPVSRLPRFSLLLEHILKLTDAEHPDKETLPLILSILSEFIKSTQPGIAVSESKVKLWDLCDSLVYVKGEIIDMDLYDESRSLVHSGPLARRQRSEVDWYGWTDLMVALLDNYLVLTREETRPNGVLKRHLVSRPLPLEYVQLGAFDGPPENRRERADDGGILESLRHSTKQMFPFTVYHVSSKSNRRYTLYATNETGRKRWYDCLVDAIGVHKIRAESNMFYEPRVLTDRFFMVMAARVAYNTTTSFTGKITCAVFFNSGGKSFIAVGCASGIFVAIRGQENFRRVLALPNPTAMVALGNFNKFIIHHESSLLSYSIDILARVGQGNSQPETLDGSLEKIAGQDGNVLFFRAGRVGKRTLIIFASKSFLHTTIQTLEAIHPADLHLAPTRSNSGPAIGGALRSFRPFGGSFYVPKDPHDATLLVKTIAITTEKGVVIVDPTNLSKSIVNIVPDFSAAQSNQAVALLKSRCEAARPLGLVRSGASELLVVYDVLGCYITKHGEPGRAAGYIRWETKATSYARHGSHILLFSPQYIEVRHISTGRLDQVIEADDIRLVHADEYGIDNAMLAVMKGTHADKDGQSEKVVELQATSVISSAPSTIDTEALWDQWDMS